MFIVIPVVDRRPSGIHTQVQTRYKEDIFYNEGGETLEHFAQRGGRCPNPGNVQGQLGWGSEQFDVVKDVPAHRRAAGPDDF